MCYRCTTGCARLHTYQLRLETRKWIAGGRAVRLLTIFRTVPLDDTAMLMLVLYCIQEQLCFDEPVHVGIFYRTLLHHIMRVYFLDTFVDNCPFSKNENQDGVIEQP